MKLSSVLALSFVTLASSTTYFKETFDNEWSKRWVESTSWKSKGDMGSWSHTSGKWHGDKEDKGIKTDKDARFYGLSAKLDSEFNNLDKDLVIQFSVKHEQKLDCGGAYIKLLPSPLDQKSFGGDSEYAIMFGPDICGTGKYKTHVILNYNDENLECSKDIKCEKDQLSHLYTLIVKPDNTFEVLIDQKPKESGSLYDNFAFLAPKEIKDPTVTRPVDWVDESMIPDPEDIKPENYDNVPETIPDPDATQPEDWNEDEDGEWEAPFIPNHEYMGIWEPKMIDNPDYQGEWVHPLIPNPDYKNDETVYNVCKNCMYVGFELWQVKSGTIFDDIIVTDSIEEAESFAAETWLTKVAGEKEMFEKQEKDKKEAEAKRKANEEAERKKREEEEDDEDDNDWEEEEL